MLFEKYYAAGPRQVPHLGDDRRKTAEARGIPNEARCHWFASRTAHSRPKQMRRLRKQLPVARARIEAAARGDSEALRNALPRLPDGARHGGAARRTTRGRRSFTIAASSRSRGAGAAGRARVLPPLPKDATDQSPRFRPLAGVAGESADGARDREPRLGRVLRPRHRAHDRGLRLPGRTADASGVARLAGRRVRQATAGR